MNHDFWLSRWEQNKIGFHQAGINTHLTRWIGELGVKEGDHLFVPLAGKSRDMLWMAEQGYDVLGVELSPVAVDAFFAENDLDPVREEGAKFVTYESGPIRLLRGDFFDLAPADLAGTAAVYDRASLIAFPPAMRERYARHLITLLPREARILLVTVEYPDGEMNGPPFSVPDATVHELFDADFTVRDLDEHDALADEENERFRERGLTRLTERVYLLTRR